MSELDTLRSEIDEIDTQLTALFLRRMDVTRRVGEYKQAHGIPVLDPAREREVLAKKTAQVSDPALRDDVAALYEAIMGISRRQQRRLVKEAGREDYVQVRAAWDGARSPLDQPRVLYQGEPGAYADEAAARFFGEDILRSHVGTWEEVFQALQRGEADYAVLPVENSSTGSIRQVYDLLAQYNYYVVGECQVKVEHCLMALPGAALEDIQAVYSHEQGLMQCERYLDAHRGWRRVPTLDTAGSAKQVAESGDRTAAAICSRRAAQIYGLHILAEGVNYNAMNHTRFVVVSPVLELRPGRNKISAVFRLPHQSGSLHEILTIFAVHGLNMVRLESRPIQGSSWEYMFFLEFTGDVTASGMEGVFRELTQSAEQVRVLGNFASNLS